MTYKNVLDDFFAIISNHKMIKTAGYGPLSEIKVPRGQYDTNYPYAFLQPTNHSLGKGQMTYRFNLIMMELPKDDIDSVIKAQSQCLEYVKDILGHFYYHLSDYDFNLNVSVIPFKEKYDDVVSGVTATIELTVKDGLNDCIAPFINNLDYELIVDVYTESLQTTSAGASIAFTGITLNDGNMGFYNYDVADYNSNYKLVFDGKITTNSPSWPFSDGPALKVFNGVTTTWVKPTLITGWPASFENTTTIYDVHAEFEVEASVVTLLAIGNEPDSSSFNVKSVPPSTLKIYKAI